MCPFTILFSQILILLFCITIITVIVVAVVLATNALLINVLINCQTLIFPSLRSRNELKGRSKQEYIFFNQVALDTFRLRKEKI